MNQSTLLEEVKTEEVPLELNFKDVGELQTPYVRLDPSKLELRGDPYQDHKANDIEHKNPVSSFVALRPYSAKFDETIKARFAEQPEAYLSTVNEINDAVRAEYDRLKIVWDAKVQAAEAAGTAVPVEQTLAQINATLHAEFFSNCTKYMIALVLETRTPMQD